MNKMLSNVIDKKKITKKAFIDVMHFINSYSSDQLNLSPECRLHLKLLVKCWQNEKKLTFAEFDNMKEHHIYITAELDNLSIWQKYIDAGIEFRILFHQLLLIQKGVI